MELQPEIVVLGGGSLVSSYLIPRFTRCKTSVLVLARSPIQVPEGASSAPLDMLGSPDWHPASDVTIVSLLPMTVLVPLLPRLAGVGAVVALSSTSRFSKSLSLDPAERASAQLLAEAEVEFMDWCGRNQIRFTMLRPTLIYDMVRDHNVARMAGFIRRFRILPLASPAEGLRQPIHADDVAKALFGAIGNPAASGRAFNIAGGERLTYRAMVERVFLALDLRPRLVLLPPRLLSFGLAVAAKLGLLRTAAFGSSVFERMNEDLVFDVDEGLRVLGYDPRRFDPSTPIAIGPTDQGSAFRPGG